MSIKMIRVTLTGAAHFQRRCAHCGHQWVASVKVAAFGEDMRAGEGARQSRQGHR